MVQDSFTRDINTDLLLDCRSYNLLFFNLVKRQLLLVLRGKPGSRFNCEDVDVSKVLDSCDLMLS